MGAKMNKRQLDDWLDAYLLYTSNTEPPTQFHRWIGLSVIASALQRKCRLDWGSLTFYPNLYIVLVAPSGRARKGTAMSIGLSMLEEIGIKLAAESITREALVRELADANLSVVYPDSDRVEFHSSLTIFSPELTVFLGHNNFQLMSDLTDWYDCRTRWVYRTKNMGTDEIMGVWVNLIGATTPSLIQTALPMDAIGGGLTSRIIFVFEQNKGKIVAAPFLTDEERILRTKLIQDLEQIRLLQGQFRVTKQFVPLWVDWYHAQENAPPFNDMRFMGYIERRPNHIMKLCQILNASRTSSMTIDACDLEKAISILNATEKKMPLAFSGVGRLEYADILSDIIEYCFKNKTVKISDLMTRYASDADPKLMSSIIESLAIRKIVQVGMVGEEKVLRYIEEAKPLPYTDGGNGNE
jgi:hypothetical protein